MASAGRTTHPAPVGRRRARRSARAAVHRRHRSARIPPPVHHHRNHGEADVESPAGEIEGGSRWFADPSSRYWSSSRRWAPARARPAEAAAPRLLPRPHPQHPLRLNPRRPRAAAATERARGLRLSAVAPSGTIVDTVRVDAMSLPAPCGTWNTPQSSVLRAAWSILDWKVPAGSGVATPEIVGTGGRLAQLVRALA